MQKTSKVLTGVLAGVLGIVGGVAATSYAIGSEKAKITAKTEELDKNIDRLMNLFTLTQTDISNIRDSISQIKSDVAVLKALQEQGSTQQ